MQNQTHWLAVLTIIKQESASCVIEYGRACRCDPTDEPYATFKSHNFLCKPIHICFISS